MPSSSYNLPISNASASERLSDFFPPTSDDDDEFKDADGDVDMDLNGSGPALADIETTGEEVRTSTSNPQGSFSLNGIL